LFKANALGALRDDAFDKENKTIESLYANSKP
jgi:hypothetical protein